MMKYTIDITNMTNKYTEIIKKVIEMVKEYFPYNELEVELDDRCCATFTIKNFHYKVDINYIIQSRCLGLIAEEIARNLTRIALENKNIIIGEINYESFSKSNKINI